MFKRRMSLNYVSAPYISCIISLYNSSETLFCILLIIQGGDGGDEAAAAARQMLHFDHSFKGTIHTLHGKIFSSGLGGSCEFQSRPVQIECTSNFFTITEEKGLSDTTRLELTYADITAIEWDHSTSAVKISLEKQDTNENFAIFGLESSVQFEHEMKLRLSGMVHQNNQLSLPTFTYVGMFAGGSKPKPFQRKRPNLSKIPSGKLPSLEEMRSEAIKLHNKTYFPCSHGQSRRLDLAIEHIHTGQVDFSILSIRGPPDMTSRVCPESKLTMKDEGIQFSLSSHASPTEYSYEDIENWEVIETSHYNNYNGEARCDDRLVGDIEIYTSEAVISVTLVFVRDAQHSLEFFWNKFSSGIGAPIKLGSTHGRPLETVTTLSGELQAPEAPDGSSDVVDQDGNVVRPGSRVQRRGSTFSAFGSNEPQTIPMVNSQVRPHWHKVVKHQGWLLKKGGLGIGSAKNWIKRYFVLYETCQGHFMVYYSDITESPLYTNDKNHRNIVDLCKACYIRPGSIKDSKAGDTPEHSFDIVTTEREWTLCAETQENMQKWLRLLTRAIDEDVAILPDEQIVFMVKPKTDPTRQLNPNDYSTALKLSAHGVSVTTPAEKAGGEIERHFWVYTDFFKWSVFTQQVKGHPQGGKVALMLTIFTDSSFRQKQEFSFRNKEAPRLATVIEYFIEKFMTVMHIKLELKGDITEVDRTIGRLSSDRKSEEKEARPPMMPEMDLLDLNGGNDDTYPSTESPFSDSDPFASGSLSYAPAILPATNPAASMDPTDPFGLSSDPFGSAIPPAPPAQAPSLTSEQTSQHKLWLLQALGKKSGPLYDDGVLQIATTLEVRGSQARLTINYKNKSASNVQHMNCTVVDNEGLARVESVAGPENIPPNTVDKQVAMIECMKPVGSFLELSMQYMGADGMRQQVVSLPVCLLSFNEAIVFQQSDFQKRFDMLSHSPDQSCDIVLPLSRQFSYAQLLGAMTTTLNFGQVQTEGGDGGNILCAGQVRTGTLTATGEKVNVGCLVNATLSRQMDQLSLRIRALTPAATVAVKNLMEKVFS
jgi:hypothetical protein